MCSELSNYGNGEGSGRLSVSFAVERHTGRRVGRCGAVSRRLTFALYGHDQTEQESAFVSQLWIWF